MQINIEKIRKEKPIQELIKFSIINVDKPTGPTSFSIDKYIMKALNLNKTSHFGTLDPMVTGVLPIALGRACRLNEYFMHRNKIYIGIMKLHKENISDEILQKVITKFIGKIKQLPPLRSRVKREIREREIVSFKILERKGKEVLFETEVQAGTYIRKLIHDMGEDEEIQGAHMLELRRTKAGLFDENSKEFPLTNLYDFDKALEEYKKGNDKLLKNLLIPGEVVSRLLPAVQVNPKSLKQLLTGKPLFGKDIKDALPEQERFALFNKDVLIGIYRKSKEGDIIARPEFVLN
jgi:H/ACA ribonucleoprotein complex subunit 4